MYQILGGILIVAAGVYIIHRKKLDQKIKKRMVELGGMMKDAFMDGYTGVVTA